MLKKLESISECLVDQTKRIRCMYHQDGRCYFNRADLKEAEKYGPCVDVCRVEQIEKNIIPKRPHTERY